MNLLTDIIRDVAEGMNLKLTEQQLLDEQDSMLQNLTARLGWMKHKQIISEGMPWLEKKREKVA